MEKQKDETAVLKRVWVPAAGGYEYQIRVGNNITLAELFSFAMEDLSCFDIYNIYTNFPVWISRRIHSVSHTPGGTKRRNAKILHHAETGKWGWNNQPLAVDTQPLAGHLSSAAIALES